MANRGRSDAYRPRYDDHQPPPKSHDAQGAMFHFGQNQSSNSTSHRRRPDFTFRSRAPFKMSERKLLTHKHEQEERTVLGSVTDSKKFRAIDDLTDSDEAEMEDSDEEPKRKRARVVEEKSANKWSNPDPYTSLPPPTETSGKGFDVIRLIRKARNILTTNQNDTSTNQNDFISFDAGTDFNRDDVAPPVGAPSGPRGVLNNPRQIEIPSVGSRFPETKTTGKRKRGQDVEESALLGGRGRSQFHADGMVLREWRMKDDINGTPWLKDCDENDTAAIRLHKEILDFYEWVKPRDYEFVVRADVVDRLSKSFNKLFPGELQAFGSYAAGLYLPTGDMDLVYVFRQGNILSTKSVLRKFEAHINHNQIARPGTTQPIFHAKVPILKFVDQRTGLKIDLCFNNDSGTSANNTFQAWKKIYPTMPILVSVIKQYLMIRGLNDVSVGGLGGFSTICLATSLLQHMPFNGTPPNLGEILIEFFNLYGNLFNRERVGIRLDPPGYIDKMSYNPHVHNNEKPDRLTIVDPNRPDNNISGGSHEINRIFLCFSRAYDTLQERLTEFADRSPGQSFSFLEDIVGGDFLAYDKQRRVLYDLHDGTSSSAPPAIIPPPPPPISGRPTVPPPPPPHPWGPASKRNNTKRGPKSTSQTSFATGKPTSRSVRRVQRSKNKKT